jgi:hypothetical protein
VSLYHDHEAAFARAYGAEPLSFLIRPDGHIGWRGWSWRERSLREHLDRILYSSSRS